VSEFSDWEFMLDGDSQDFRELASRRGSFYFNIYGGVDHWNDCPNDDFRMTTLYCQNESDPNVIWQIGYELVSLFNGASILLDKNARKTSIFRVLHNEKQVEYFSQNGTPALLGKPPFNQYRINEEFQNGAKSSRKFPLIHLATENKDVYFILRYLTMEPSWTNYYKLMEAVEEFAAIKNIELNLDKAKRKSLTNTANNFSLSGFDSRHGFKEELKKNNTASMTLEEAYFFVTGVTKSFINSAYFS